jgi:hypothetical protein
MSDSKEPDSSPKGQFLVYRAEDGRVQIDVRLENETVWLTQQHMAELFQTTQKNISLHIQNIYQEGELQPAATHKESLSVRQEGIRKTQAQIKIEQGSSAAGHSGSCQLRSSDLPPRIGKHYPEVAGEPNLRLP